MRDENFYIKHRERTSLAAHNHDGMGPLLNTYLSQNVKNDIEHILYIIDMH